MKYPDRINATKAIHVKTNKNGVEKNMNIATETEMRKLEYLLGYGVVRNLVISLKKVKPQR